MPTHSGLVRNSQLQCDGLVLEVIAEGEVAQHLEEGAVAGGLADVLDIAGADALLAGGRRGGAAAPARR